MAGIGLILVYVICCALPDLAAGQEVHSQKRRQRNLSPQGASGARAQAPRIYAVPPSKGLRQIGSAGKRIRAASSAVAVDATKLSSSAETSMPVWPIKSRTSAGALSVRCRRLSLSGSTRECLPWM